MNVPRVRAGSKKYVLHAIATHDFLSIPEAEPIGCDAAPSVPSVLTFQRMQSYPSVLPLCVGLSIDIA